MIPLVSLLEQYSRDMSIYVHRIFYEDVQRSLIHNSPTLEIIQRAMKRKIDH